MRRSPSPSGRARPGTVSRRPQDTAYPNQLSVFLLMAMYASINSGSRSLVPHANGLGDGYSEFQFDAHASMDHLVSTIGIASGLTSSTAIAPEQDEGGEEEEGFDFEAVRTPRDAESPHEDEGMEIEEESILLEEEDHHHQQEEEETTVPLSASSVLGSVVVAASSSTVRGRTDASPSSSSSLSLSDLPPLVLAQALEFLTVPEINRLRRTAAPLARAAAWIAPQPFGTPSVTFVRCGWLADLPDPIPRPHAPPTPFEWRCMNCHGYSSYHEACTLCGTNVRHAATRVFVGQLRKRHSATALRHLLKLFLPSISILHIESHSNREGFEKGAAWLYVDSPQDAIEVLQLNKRVFFDADSEGAEGFWFIDGQSEEEIEGLKTHLLDFAAARRADDDRKRMCLPGQPLVVELPARSMLSGAAPLHRATLGMVADERGWFHRR